MCDTAQPYCRRADCVPGGHSVPDLKMDSSTRSLVKGRGARGRGPEGRCAVDIPLASALLERWNLLLLGDCSPEPSRMTKGQGGPGLILVWISTSSSSCRARVEL